MGNDVILGIILCAVIFAIIAWLSVSSKERDWEITTKTTPPDDKNTNSDDLFLTEYNNPSVYDRVHHTFADMLWFYNGPHKNYSHDFGYPIEPSRIDDTLDIIHDIDTEPLSYYPKYVAMSDEQRGKYIDFLSTPELYTDDIGYVFVFYYGLERHLYCGNFDKAFDIILYLREKYDNRSFLTYSATALILSAIKHDKMDRLREFFEILDFDKSKYIDINLLIYGKIKSGYPLDSADIASHGKDFGFSNQLYIKKYPDLFLETLEYKIKEHYNMGIPIYSLEFDEYDEYTPVYYYANSSLCFEKIDVPVFTGFSNFVYDINNLLNETHELVKVKTRKKEVSHI